LLATRHSQRFCQVWNAFFGMANNPFVEFFWVSSNVLKQCPFKVDFSLANKKVRWSQIWRVGWLRYNGCFVFRQKIAHKERQVSWCIVMVQHPTLVRPQLRPPLAYGFPQMIQNCYVKLLVYCLTTWNEFVVDYTLPVKENHQHHLHVGSTHLSFLQSG